MIGDVIGARRQGHAKMCQVSRPRFQAQTTFVEAACSLVLLASGAPVYELTRTLEMLDPGQSREQRLTADLGQSRRTGSTETRW